MKARLNLLIGLHVLIALSLVVLVRLTFTIFYQSLPEHRRCDWNWTDGLSASECHRRLDREAIGIPADADINATEARLRDLELMLNAGTAE